MIWNGSPNGLKHIRIAIYKWGAMNTHTMYLNVLYLQQFD